MVECDNIEIDENVNDPVVTGDKSDANAVEEVLKKVKEETEKSQSLMRRSKRTKLTAFLNEPVAARNRSVLCSDDFETPVKMVKCAPKLKLLTRGGGKKRPARQLNIKSAFLRNEELFAAVTAQHCMADNFSPDDVQMALAMSISEAEVKSVDRDGAAKDDVMMVDLVPADGDAHVKYSAQQSLRCWLQQYGFHTAARQEYDTIAATILPSGKRRGKTHSKWMNKFTALTLRKPVDQQQKVQDRVKAILALQCKTRPLKACDSQAPLYIPQSLALRQILAPSKVASSHRNLDCQATVDLADYFIGELFEVSHVLAGYLLKDWVAIQGRDSSPQRRGTRDQLREEKLQKIYAELELHFGSCRPSAINTKLIKAPTHEEDCDARSGASQEKSHDRRKVWRSGNELIEANGVVCMVKSVDEGEAESVDIEEETNALTKVNSALPTPPTPPFRNRPDKRVCLEEYDETKASRLSAAWLQVPAMPNARATSPDLFADSDAEDEPASVASWPETAGYKVEAEIIRRQPSAANTFSCPLDTERWRMDRRNKISLKDGSIIDLTLGEAEKVNTKYDDQKQKSGSPLKRNAVTATNENSFETLWCQWPTSETCLSVAKSKSFWSAEVDQRPKNAQSFVKHLSLTQLADAGSSTGLKRRMSTSCTRRSSGQNVAVVLGLPEASVDLTQSDDNNDENSDTGEDDDECFILSDDEINYSIWKSNCTNNQHRNTSVGIKDLTVSSESETEQLLSGLNAANAHAATNAVKLSMRSLIDGLIPIETSSNRMSVQSIYSPDLKSTAQDSSEHAELSVLELGDKQIPVVTSLKRKSHQSMPDLYSATVAPYSTDCAEFSLIELNDESISVGSPPKTAPFVRSFDCVTEPWAEEIVTPPRIPPEHSNGSHWPQGNLSKERAEFGILEGDDSEPFTLWPSLTGGDCEPIPADSSLLYSPCKDAALMRHYSTTSSRKFDSLLRTERNAAVFAAADDSDIDCADFDEFDKLIYGSPVRTSNVSKRAEPTGLQQLLTGEITFYTECADAQPKTILRPSSQNEILWMTRKEPKVSASELRQTVAGRGRSNVHEGKCTPRKLIAAPAVDAVEEHVINGRIYCVRTDHGSMPDYVRLSEPELLRELNNYGIKPLKRKQSIQMLQYIYTQTHPILVEDNVVDNAMDDAIDGDEAPGKDNSNRNQDDGEDGRDYMASVTHNANMTGDVHRLILEDCCDSGEALLRYVGELSPIALAPAEDYILQTNITKKVAQPLLPFQIAWFNLLSSCTALHEHILAYDPIDLQQIYLHFKRMGHRYDPKDLKAFFDRRCIIFRFDLNIPTAQQTRPTTTTSRLERKKTKATNKRYALSNNL